MFVFTMFLLVIGLLGIAASFFVPKEATDSYHSTIHPRRWVGFISAGVVALSVLLFIPQMVVTVNTKNVGIVTSFGKTSGHLSNGLHVIAPWESVTEMDAAIQTDSYTGATAATTNTNTASGPCLEVRIANQQTACLDVSIKWRINPSAADELYQNYHDFATVQDSLVYRELVQAVNANVTNYNPLNSIIVPGVSNGINPTYAQISAAVTAQMRTELKGQIEVVNTIIPYIRFDAATQNRINQLQTQEAQTRIAAAQLATNQAQAVANAALAQSVDNSPGVLQSRCLDIINEEVKAGMNPAAGAGAGSCLNAAGAAAIIAKG